MQKFSALPTAADFPRIYTGRRKDMKTTGVVREIDTLGRIVIPKEMRETVGIEPRDALEISLEGSRIVMTKHFNSCIFCQSTEDTLLYQGKLVCRSCLSELNQAAEEADSEE